MDNIAVKLQHYKITFKALRSKLEEITKSQNEDSEGEAGTSSEDSKEDFSEQRKMIENIINEQKEKEALEQEKLKQEEEINKAQEANKRSEEEHIFEIMLEEEKVKKTKDFLKKFGIDSKEGKLDYIKEIIFNHDHPESAPKTSKGLERS